MELAQCHVRHVIGLGIFHQEQDSWQVAGIKAEATPGLIMSAVAATPSPTCVVSFRIAAEKHNSQQVNDRHNRVGGSRAADVSGSVAFLMLIPSSNRSQVHNYTGDFVFDVVTDGLFGLLIEE